LFHRTKGRNVICAVTWLWSEQPRNCLSISGSNMKLSPHLFKSGLELPSLLFQITGGTFLEGRDFGTWN